MASQFSIAEADITPDPIPTELFSQLTDWDGDGSGDVVTLDVIEEAEADFLSFVGGMFTAAANIALALPQVKKCIVYRFHWRRAQNAAATIPEDVKEAYKMAIKWAENHGSRLLATEGNVTPADGGGVSYDAPTSYHGLTNLDRL